MRLSTAIKMDPERPEYHRATLQWSKCPIAVEGGSGGAEEEWAWWAVSTGNQVSSRLLSARWASRAGRAMTSFDNETPAPGLPMPCSRYPSRPECCRREPYAPRSSSTTCS